MKKTNKFLVTFASLGMVIAGGAAISMMTKNVIETSATTTTVASYSRSGTTDTVTGGTLTATTLSGKTGYYQDAGTAGTTVCTLQVLNTTTALFSAAPAGSIDITATLGGGTTKASGVDLMAALLDKDGRTVGTEIKITDAITATTGSDFTASFVPSNYASVYGFKLYHTKINGWNVRYFSASLGGNDTYAQSLEVETNPTKTTYQVGETLDLTGLVVNKYSAPQTKAATTAYTTVPANGATLDGSTNTVTITSTETGVTGASFQLVLAITPTKAVELVTTATLTTGNNLSGNYIVNGTVKTVTDATNHRFVITDGTKDVYAYGYSSVAVTDLCVGGTISVYCTLGAYTNTYSTDSLTELSSLTILSNVNPAETFANWMMNASRDAEVCADKWSAAKAQYNSLVTEQKALFLTGSSVGIIVNARARYNAWAAANSEAAGSAKFAFSNSESEASVIAVFAFLTVAGGTYLYIRRRKHA